MQRAIIILLAAAGLGWLGGTTQSTLATRGFEERFTDSRRLLDEREGKVSREQLLNATGKPKIEVIDGSEYHFGTMKHGETMSHDFVVRNSGDGPLNIELVDASCKCTVGKLESSVIPPGEDSIVHLTWTAQTRVRLFGQSATLKTNCEGFSELKLVVKGTVVDSFVTEPAAIVLGDLGSTDSVQRTFHVMSYLKESKEIKNFRWSNPETADLIQLEHKKIAIDADKFPEHRNCESMYEVQLTMNPGMPIGRLMSKIQFETDMGEDVGTINVPVTGKIVGSVSLIGSRSLDPERNRVDFGTVSSQEGASITIFMRINRDLPDGLNPKIASVRPEGSLTATLGEATTRSGKTIFPIRLEIPKGAKPITLTGPTGKLHGKVVIKTNGDSGEEIPIYIRMAVTK